MFSFSPAVELTVIALAPGFRAISILVEASEVQHPEVAREALDDACRAVAVEDVPYAEAHIAAWREAFKAFGAKPARTPSSVEALRKRVVRDGALPAIDPIVDLYNAISIKYALPIGGENAAAYVGDARLVRADGSERFDTLKGGEPVEESPEPGEVIWRDDLGVTCRRWNWRQGVRTRLDASAQQMWFILESLPEMPIDALHQASDALIAGLEAMMPGCRIEKQLLGAGFS
ncbi:hypothetical protein PANPA_00222 (plasmid) [Pantoea sp. Nvir]|uniref:B3/B4 domain-containing protein n=1 Tax=unclassified Pantoea TaxID=2630326 RepID=UPI001EF727AA|nr:MULTISPECIES: B3/4 domain-containing protein [unclassified Pantoea]MCG7367600.1 B3/4 domain-containing protein [Pantoea sp. ACRSH]MCG7398110.1 B3/4 domain-containing protein [Pantoea sp. ACRSC]